MAQENSLKPTVQGGDDMAIEMDSLDYYYNVTNGRSCWGAGKTTSYGYYDPSNKYMLNNATQIYQDLTTKGWSYNAIMAVLGNMSYESYINPAQSEIGQPLDGTYGYGLVQWTPRNTTIEPYMNNHGHPLTSGYYQLDYLDLGEQWIPKSAYGNMSWSQFKVSNLDVEYLTTVFLKCYERGKAHRYRQECARYYANFFSGSVSGNHIYVTYEGNGVAYAIPTVVDYGDTFILDAIADDNDDIEDITGTTSTGQSIAMTIAPHVTYDYRQEYGDFISIHVKFSGETPPIPPKPPIIKNEQGMPIWEYPCWKWRRL